MRMLVEQRRAGEKWCRRVHYKEDFSQQEGLLSPTATPKSRLPCLTPLPTVTACPSVITTSLSAPPPMIGGRGEVNVSLERCLPLHASSRAACHTQCHLHMPAKSHTHSLQGSRLGKAGRKGASMPAASHVFQPGSEASCPTLNSPATRSLFSTGSISHVCSVQACMGKFR